jgi:hypothetical protein
MSGITSPSHLAHLRPGVPSRLMVEAAALGKRRIGLLLARHAHTVCRSATDGRVEAQGALELAGRRLVLIAQTSTRGIVALRLHGVGYSVVSMIGGRAYHPPRWTRTRG